ncbi:MAG: prepilin-type N-terminal cleavage/methylation domain-containing protein [Chitinispirillaceae bacterium]|nr:prepilin-type N-terminal cleavage/methylation domain-containing protein [Chitinispirillaceae bacterium]
MKHKNGFTLIEMSFAVIVIGIIGAGVMLTLNSFLKYHTLEKTTWTVFKEFSTLRSKAMKDNCTVKVNFLSINKFEIHTDLNNNLTADANEKRDTVELSSFVVFGLPSKTKPKTAPTGTTLPNGNKYVTGDWATNGIIIDNTASAVVNTGGLFLSSPDFEKHTFCVAVTDCTQIFKLYKWDGKTWIDLR